jgi:hypothetical protein
MLRGARAWCAARVTRRPAHTSPPTSSAMWACAPPSPRQLSLKSGSESTWSPARGARGACATRAGPHGPCHTRRGRHASRHASRPRPCRVTTRSGWAGVLMRGEAPGARGVLRATRAGYARRADGFIPRCVTARSRRRARARGGRGPSAPAGCQSRGGHSRKGHFAEVSEFRIFYAPLPWSQEASGYVCMPGGRSGLSEAYSSSPSSGPSSRAAPGGRRPGASWLWAMRIELPVARGALPVARRAVRGSRAKGHEGDGAL